MSVDQPPLLLGVFALDSGYIVNLRGKEIAVQTPKEVVKHIGAFLTNWESGRSKTASPSAVVDSALTAAPQTVQAPPTVQQNPTSGNIVVGQAVMEYVREEDDDGADAEGVGAAVASPPQDRPKSPPPVPPKERLSLNKQIQALRSMSMWFMGGADPKGNEFGPKEWDAYREVFAPDVSAQEAELVRGETIAALREDEADFGEGNVSDS